MHFIPLIPAQAGIQSEKAAGGRQYCLQGPHHARLKDRMDGLQPNVLHWIPAFAGMSGFHLPDLA